jgi:hypothetical protein
MTDSSPLLRPIPRRAFDMTPVSGNSTNPPTPSPNESDDPVAGESKTASKESLSSRTRSVLNLTSSTLFGIYAPSEEPSTPWGNGAQTPSWRPSVDDKVPPLLGAYTQSALSKPHPQHRFTIWGTFPSLARRTTLLFVLGVAYGVIIIHLHDNQQLAPVKIEGIERYSKWYLITWGIAGVLLGTLLPWVDTYWEEGMGDYEFDLPAEAEKDRPRSLSTSTIRDDTSSSPSWNDSRTDWTPVIRSIGAFIGIAFAIVSLRRLP